MKVLVVDDDVIQRMLLVDLLGRFERVEIVEAADGLQAWEVVQDGLCPVLCCCDMHMPRMSGLDLFQKFKSRAALAKVPFIFVTASVDRKTIERAIALGAADYILKPVSFTKARASLDKVFHRIYERYSETPSATQKRLKIPPGKLIGYYDALGQQLIDARPHVPEQLSADDAASVRNVLDSLKSACITLGLWHAANMIDCVHELEVGLIERVLADVEAAIVEQTLDARKEFGIRELRSVETKDARAQEKDASTKGGEAQALDAA